jgi:ankyrin repeat protein
MNDSLSSPEKLHHRMDIASLLFSETLISDDFFYFSVEEVDFLQGQELQVLPLDPVRRLVQQSIARGHLGHAIQLQENVLSWCARAYRYTPTRKDAETEVWRAELLTYKTIHDRLLEELERYTDIAGPEVDYLPIPSDISAFITMSVRSRVFQESTDVLGRSLLHVAVACKHVDALKLIDISTMVSHQDLFGMTPLHVACMCGNVDAVQALLSSGASVSLESKAGEGQWLPLHFAAASGNCEVIEKLAHILLEKGLDINSQTEPGQTAITIAASEGHERAVHLLINLGADPKITDDLGDNSFHNAIRRGHYDVAACLLERYGGILNVPAARPATSGETPLHLAIWCLLYGSRIEDRRRIVRLLLSHVSTDPNATTPGGDTALHTAVRDRYKADVELLLSYPAVSRGIKNRDGKTPLFVAAEDGSEAMVELLLGCEGVETEVEDNNGETPLSIAIERGHIAVAQLIQRFQKARRAAQIGTSTGPDRIEDRTGYEDFLMTL